MSRTVQVHDDIQSLETRLTDINLTLATYINICNSKPSASATPKEHEEIRKTKVECARLINDLTREKVVIENKIKQLKNLTSTKKGGMRRTRNNKKHQKNKKNKSRSYKNKQKSL